MTLFDRIIAELRSTDGPVGIEALSRHVGVPVSALEPMLDHLAAAGLIRRGGPRGATMCGVGCGVRCRPEQCPIGTTHPTHIERPTVSTSGNA